MSGASDVLDTTRVKIGLVDIGCVDHVDGSERTGVIVALFLLLFQLSFKVCSEWRFWPIWRYDVCSRHGDGFVYISVESRSISFVPEPSAEIGAMPFMRVLIPVGASQVNAGWWKHHQLGEFPNSKDEALQ